MRYVLCVILLLFLAMPLVFADRFVDQEAQQILSSDSLVIDQEIATQTQISGELNWLEVTHSFYPKDTYRQSVRNENHGVQFDEKNDTHISFRVKNPPSLTTVSSTYTIQTQNVYKEIGANVPFPIQDLPDDVLPYLEETEFIDITPEIKATASLIASGKDDLFAVSQDVATWVVTNIEYDLSTLTADAVQKASWVIKNRQGVCDELSILYIAMMRSLGIPARYVSGISYTNSDLFEEPWNPHAWTEVYFPEHGWVPFDLTYQQFGYIDASHITFSTSADAGKILTSYLWEGYDLDATDIVLDETVFNQDVISYGQPVDEGFDIDIEPMYTTIGLRSYNILEVTLENKKNHYVSSTLYINAPYEVSMEKNKLPIYIEPLETKTYYILQSLSGLSPGYVYTFPVSVFTSFGSSVSTEFKAAEKYSHISLDQVNAYLTQNTKSTELSSFSIQCSPETDTASIQENVDVICSLGNNGNVYLTDGELCFEDDCQIITLEISASTTKTFTVSENTPGEYAYDASVEFSNVKETAAVNVAVADIAKIDISSVNFTDIIPGEDFKGSVLLDKVSNSIPQNIDLRVNINGDLYSWNLDSLPQKTEIQIPLHSYLLQDGKNTVEVFVSWDDRNEGGHFAETTTTLDVEFSLLDKLQSWWFKLLY